MNRLRFTKVRDVKSPTRSNQGDAGLDFHIPKNLTVEDLLTANQSAEGITIKSYVEVGNQTKPDCINYGYNPNDYSRFISSLTMGPYSRILIPSGIRVLIEPMDSMLMAANKSGISTKKGLIYTAEIVDSPYVGEVHIGIINPTQNSVDIDFNKAVLQFIHVPIYLTEPEEITLNEYNREAENWGTRGEKGFGEAEEEQ